jgi:hypothetical protein
VELMKRVGLNVEASDLPQYNWKANIWEIDIKDNLKMENDKVKESFFMQMEEYMKVIGIMI